MNKWYSKWWIWCIFLLMVVLIFYVIKIYPNFDDVSSGDLLNFYGALLSFIGTIVLGIVASHQSWKANRLSERLLKIEEERYLPIIDIQEIMEIPSPLPQNAYNNAMNIKLNQSLFYFAENNEVSYCTIPIYVFKLKNICSSHIISVEVTKIEQNTKFENKKVINAPIDGFTHSGGVCILGTEESQYFIISGIKEGYPHGLSSDEVLSQGYVNPFTELIIHFKLTNIKGQSFYESIKLSFFSLLLNENKIYFPCIAEKKILTIEPIK